MRLGEVDLALAALDVLEPDLVPEVDAADARRGDLHLTEAAMEYLCALHQGQVCTLLKGCGRDEVGDVVLLEFESRWCPIWGEVA